MSLRDEKAEGQVAKYTPCTCVLGCQAGTSVRNSNTFWIQKDIGRVQHSTAACDHIFVWVQSEDGH